MQVCTSGTDHTFRRIGVSTGKLNWWYLCYESQINNTFLLWESNKQCTLSLYDWKAKPTHYKDY